MWWCLKTSRCYKVTVSQDWQLLQSDSLSRLPVVYSDGRYCLQYCLLFLVYLESLHMLCNTHSLLENIARNVQELFFISLKFVFY